MTISRSKKTPSKKVSTPRRQSTVLVKIDVAFTSELVRDLSAMIEVAQKQVATVANAALTQLHWQIGRHVHTQVLEGRRAEHGAQIVATVSRQWEARFGRGFGEKNLRRMIQFVEAFPDREIVAALLRRLGWTHFTMLIPLEDKLSFRPCASLVS